MADKSQLERPRTGLIAALGGAGQISPRMAVVETCVRTRLLLDHVDAHLLALGALVTGAARWKKVVRRPVPSSGPPTLPLPPRGLPTAR